MRVNVYGSYVWVRKCVNADEFLTVDGQKQYKKGQIFVPDEHGEYTNFAEIIDVGPQCREFTKDHIGLIVMCPEMSERMHRMGSLVDEVEDFAIQESELLKRCAAVFE